MFPPGKYSKTQSRVKTFTVASSQLLGVTAAGSRPRIHLFHCGANPKLQSAKPLHEQCWNLCIILSDRPPPVKFRENVIDRTRSRNGTPHEKMNWDSLPKSLTQREAFI